MEGKATITEKPITLRLSPRPMSQSSTPGPHYSDQTGLYGYPPPSVIMPMWGYPPGLGGASQPVLYPGVSPPVSTNSRPALGNPGTSLDAVVIPDITTWFSFLDQHEQQNKDGITFALYGTKLKAKGFIRLSQLTSEFVQLKDLKK